MKVNAEITIDAPIEEVWKVLGQQFDQVDQWASSVNHSASRAGGPKVPGAPMAGRTCDTEIGPVKEAIIEFDEQRHVVAYSAEAKEMPFFVKDLKNRWTLTSAPDRRTQVKTLLTARLSLPFNLLMTFPMSLKMGRLMRFAVEELKYYVETGEPHPRKVKASKAALKAAA